MAESVYVLCAVASLLCTLLLLRGYRRTRSRLLLWSSLCFGGLTCNNVLLFVDLVLVPDLNLALARSAVALAGLLILLYGLIFDSQ